MENNPTNKEIQFTEKLIELIGIEEMASKLLAISVAVGNIEMERSARNTVQRTSNQIAAMGTAQYAALIAATAPPTES